MSTKQALCYHLQKRTRCDAVITCQTCNKGFTTKEELLAHKTTCMISLDQMNAILCGIIPQTIIIVDRDLNVLVSDDPKMIGKCYISTINKNQRESLSNQIRYGVQNYLIRKVNHKTTYISSFPSVDGNFVITERIFEAKYKLPGFLTP